MKQILFILLLILFTFNAVADDYLWESPIHPEQKGHFIIAVLATAASLIFGIQLVIRSDDNQGVTTYGSLVQVSLFTAINNWSKTYSQSSNNYYSYHKVGDDIKFTFINKFPIKEQDIIQPFEY